MAATYDEILSWLKIGKRDGATHVIVACDTFDYDDYPIYVRRGESARDRAKKITESPMQSVMEVYALHLSFEAQLAEKRSMHFEEQ